METGSLVFTMDLNLIVNVNIILVLDNGKFFGLLRKSFFEKKLEPEGNLPTMTSV